MTYTRTAFQPNQAPNPNPTQTTVHVADGGITGQIVYPNSTINAYRAGEFCAGHVATLAIGQSEVWPPADNG